jgi:hypothetical protein
LLAAGNVVGLGWPWHWVSEEKYVERRAEVAVERLWVEEEEEKRTLYVNAERS